MITKEYLQIEERYAVLERGIDGNRFERVAKRLRDRGYIVSTHTGELKIFNCEGRVIFENNRFVY